MEDWEEDHTGELTATGAVWEVKMAEQKNMQEQDINQLLKVRRDKLADLQQNGKDPFQITKFDVTHHSMDIKDNYDTLEGQAVMVAGRMMFKRVMGKASFCNIQDLKGNIQVYVARDSIGEDSYKDFKKYDVGDIRNCKCNRAAFFCMELRRIGHPRRKAYKFKKGCNQYQYHCIYDWRCPFLFTQ